MRLLLPTAKEAVLLGTAMTPQGHKMVPPKKHLFFNIFLLSPNTHCFLKIYLFSFILNLARFCRAKLTEYLLLLLLLSQFYHSYRASICLGKDLLRLTLLPFGQGIKTSQLMIL